MIFLDTNIPMYASGADDPYRAPCVRVLRLVERSRSEFITNAEVLQEIIHRYLAIRRWPDGRGLFNRFASLMAGRIESIHAVDLFRAAELADHYAGLSARDCLHAAVIQRLGLKHIASTDKRFDRVDGIERLDPMLVDEWAHLVTEAR